MAEVLLFHHALGLTPGVRKFAEDLRAAGHAVHTPDLNEGETFTDLNEGVGHAKKIGFDNILERGRQSAEGLTLRRAGTCPGARRANFSKQI